jgi:LPXTG-motif cell wall-anchored protein
MEMKRLTAITVAALLSGSVLSAQESEEPPVDQSIRTGIVIGKTEKALTLWTKNGQEKFTYAADVILPQRKIKGGNLVVVFEQTRGSRIAARVVLVDEQVFVSGRPDQAGAVIGVAAPGRSPNHLIVKTADGKEAFVVDPKVFRQPLIEPGQKVAVTYRVENVKPPIFKATGLIVLSDKLDESPIKISYSEIPRPAPVIAEAPAPMPEPEPEPEPMVTLPQTASGLPLLMLVGASLLVLGLFLRRARA